MKVFFSVKDGQYSSTTVTYSNPGGTITAQAYVRTPDTSDYTLTNKITVAINPDTVVIAVPTSYATSVNWPRDFRVIITNGSATTEVSGRISFEAATSSSGSPETLVVDDVLDLLDARESIKPKEWPFSPRIGGYNRIPGVVGANLYDQIKAEESQIGVRFTHFSNYEGINSNSASNYTLEVASLLSSDPDRQALYVFEPHYSLSTLNNALDNTASGIYTNMKNVFDAIVAGGNQNRLVIAPMHECNGSGAYPWQIYLSGNSSSLYVTVFQKIVTLARSRGVTARFMQWFLTANSGGVLDEYSVHYAGNSYVDIVGLTYYNRYDVDYTYWEPPGHNIRDAYRKIERMTSTKPIWIAESGCASEGLSGESKAKWYEDLIRLIGSGEFPRIQAVTLFLVNNTGVTGNWSLENESQRKAVKRGINSLAKPNLLAYNVENPVTTTGWTGSGTGASLAIDADGPIVAGVQLSSIKYTKPVSAGTSANDYQLYTVPSNKAYYEPKKSYVLSFWAKSDVESYKTTAGIRQGTTPSNVVGDDGIQLTTSWKRYVVQIASGAADVGSWRIPHFGIGRNTGAGSIWLAGIKFEKSQFLT